jgi:ATP-dependent helicase/nuclease subunit A
MGKIDIVSASAGSGKTTRISELLLERISAGVEPEHVLATTFTNKAAAELKQRVRARLFAAGLTSQAQRLEGARIGTVNSVCSRLVSDFAFELGLSPELRVIDEVQAGLALRRALARVCTDREQEQLQALSRRFEHGFTWTDAVQQIITHARANHLDPDALADHAERSVKGFAEHLERPARDGDALTKALLDAITRCLATVDLAEDTTKVTRGGVQTLHDALREHQAGHLRWRTWVKLQGVKSSKASAEHFEPVREAAARVGAHPRLHDDLSQVTHRIYALAARAMEAYAQAKREAGTLDFVDQEVLALRLLKRPDVRAHLADTVKVVLVDEFQDTSPLQLALFSELAELAERSYWVGDQKQAIYGFRGTDPSLMDAAIDAILAGGAPETLGTSYRSRPALVRLTSALFTRAFALHGMPAARVALEPALKREPPDLGPVLEHWHLDVENGDETGLALADGVRQLLEDSTVRVRDPATGDARPLRRGDVAVLCRTNDAAQAVAQALSAHGLPAAVAHDGLLRTPEGRAALLALRLFVDARDRLAAAELAMLLELPEAGDRWLRQVLDHAEAAEALRRRGEHAPRLFEASAFHAAMDEARARFPTAGPLVALDAAVEAIGLRELALRWGDSERRLANLDALRSHAAGYAAQVLADGRGATATGLVTHLEALEDDAQARVLGEGSVVVSTWHSAKGLEWPVCVLANLEKDPPSPVFGVHVETDARAFRLDAPLAKRWVRYWPDPFHPRQSTSSVHASLAQSVEAQRAQERTAAQELRLLYVGWTRARDRLVLATKGGSLEGAALQLLRDGAGPLLTPLIAGRGAWAGVAVQATERRAAATTPEVATPPPDAGPVEAGPQPHGPAWVMPSEARGAGASVELERIGRKATLHGQPPLDAVGSALHAFLAADRAEHPVTERLELARGCFSRHGVDGAVRAEDVVAAGDALASWVAQRWPGAAWRREWPVWQRHGDGAVTRGIADLVLELREGFVVVDHKSAPLEDEARLRAKAASYAPQLAAYAEAIARATGKRCLGRFVHFGVLGLTAQLTLENQDT